VTGRERAARRLLGTDRRLVLASASPRRAELLRGLGLDPELRPVDVPEDLAGDPAAEAVRLAEDKARAAMRSGGAALVVAADTVVAIDGEPLGKPADRDETVAMLRRLSGRTHRVMTGVAVAREADGALVSGVETTRVRFDELDDETIAALADSGDGDDKAGAYGIQSLAGLVIPAVDGDYFNVVGLPLALLRTLVRRIEAEPAKEKR
jgi:septum formation protein